MTANFEKNNSHINNDRHSSLAVIILIIIRQSLTTKLFLQNASPKQQNNLKERETRLKLLNGFKFQNLVVVFCLNKKPHEYKLQEIIVIAIQNYLV